MRLYDGDLIHNCQGEIVKSAAPEDAHDIQRADVDLFDPVVEA